MSLQVIELNDVALKVSDESGIVLQSPGFALAQDKKLLLGEAAEQKARLHPTNSYNKYWHELSLDPLSHNNGVRHYADLAYAQLLHVAEHAAVAGEVVFAVPGNFTKQQLAILLGLAKQCPFTTVGIVDSALAAAIAHATEKSIVYADLQLHQIVLTRLKIANGKLLTDTVVQVPGVGSQNFMDQMMQLATNAFIQQCRFNPQHNAESEQQLYNALPLWWQQHNQSESSQVLELQVGDSVYTAKIPRESLASSLSGHYSKLNQQIQPMVEAGNSRLLISAGLAALPGLKAALNSEHDLQVLNAEAIGLACLNNHGRIRSNEQGIRLVTALPLDTAASQANNAKAHKASQTEARPTHVLYRNRAIPLDKVKLVNAEGLNGHKQEYTVPLPAGLSEDFGQLVLADEIVYYDGGGNGFFLNREAVKGQQILHLGDRIQLSKDGEELTLIHVH